MAWIRNNGGAVLGAAALVAAVAFSAATLTSTPALFIDESWYASTAWSVSSGHGLEPTIAGGAGIYETVPDYWAARIGSLPHVLANVFFPTSFALDRLVSFLTAMLAMVPFGLALRRLQNTGVALLASAALIVSYGFLTDSHWIRWDSVALLFCTTILLALVYGPPRPTVAAGIGALVAVSPDFAVGLVGLVPAALVLCAWERDGRRDRLLGFCGGAALGVFVLVLSHGFIGAWADAREQYKIVYEPLYGEVPMLEAVKGLSLEPLIREADRYTQMSASPFFGSFVGLSVGSLAALLTILRRVGARRTTLVAAAGVGMAFIAAVAFWADVPYDDLRGLMGLLIVAGFASLVMLAVQAIRGAPYPTGAVPAMLLASMLFGYGLLVGYKGPTYTYLALPFAMAAIAMALQDLAPERLRETAPLAGLLVAFALAGGYTLAQVGEAGDDAALDSQLSVQARNLVPKGKTVMGDWIYWWLYRDERFEFNSSLWLQRWQHPAASLAQSFHRICPDFVLFDDLWRDRYLYISYGRLFGPNQSPVEPRERRQLQALLRREYRPVKRVRVDGRSLTFWERRRDGCPAPPPDPIPKPEPGFPL